MTKRRAFLAGALGIGIAARFPMDALSAQSILTWGDLIPGGGPAATPDSVSVHDEQGLPIWNAANNAPAPTRAELDGQKISIRGYHVPIAFLPDQPEKIAAFILAPFVGACIHVPPPPANQIILGSYPEGMQLESRIWFEPVTVSGTMYVQLVETSVAKVGYQMRAASIVF